MAQLIIESNKGIAFEDYLKLCMLQELDIRDNIASHFNNLPKSLHELQTKKVKLGNNPDKVALEIKLVDSEDNDLLVSINTEDIYNVYELPIDLGGDYDLIRKYYDKQELLYNINRFDSQGYPYFQKVVNKGLEKITKNFKIKDDYFILRVSQVWEEKFTIYPYECPIYKIDIESKTGEHDTYYYNPLKCTFYYDEEEKKALSNKSQAKLLSLLPSLNWEDLPATIREFIFKKSQNCYLYENELKIGIPSLLEKMAAKMNGQDIAYGYIIEVPEELSTSTENAFSQHLSEEIEESKENKKNENIKNIANSIKAMLQKLKENNTDLEKVPKIKIRNLVFYSYISDDKKEIDPFFNDPDIIKYCDLSLIDFTNANIEGFDLSDTNANIILDQLYNRSIKNANLRNINLMRQDLDGILADGADLRGTNVFVSIEKTSIIGTKFSSSTTFMLETRILTKSEVKELGIQVEKEESDNLESVLRL